MTATTIREATRRAGLACLLALVLALGAVGCAVSNTIRDVPPATDQPPLQKLPQGTSSPDTQPASTSETAGG